MVDTSHHFNLSVIVSSRSEGFFVRGSRLRDGLRMSDRFRFGDVAFCTHRSCASAHVTD